MRMPLRLVALLMIAGCAHAGSKASKAAPLPPANWRIMATRADRERLHDWRDAFVKGLAAARAAGFGAEVAREGVLLDPDAALDEANLPAGRYRCRTIKLGTREGSGPAYTTYPATDCRITDEGEAQSLALMSGMQRPTGLLFRDDARRRVFLGTMMLGDEHRPIQYGQDDARDMAGTLHRIGTARWRLVLPYPKFESLTDVVELVPAS